MELDVFERFIKYITEAGLRQMGVDAVVSVYREEEKSEHN